MFHIWPMPPSAMISVATVNADSWDTRCNTVAAIFSGVPKRPSGTLLDQRADLVVAATNEPLAMAHLQWFELERLALPSMHAKIAAQVTGQADTLRPPPPRATRP